VEFRRQLAIVRASLPLFAASLVLAAAAALLFSNLEQKIYDSRATLIVGQSLSAVNPDYNQILVSQRLSSTYATVATTRPLLEKVIAKLGIHATPDDLARNVRADAPLDSTLLTITVQDPDPARAAAIANTVSDELMAQSPTIQGRAAGFQESIDSQLDATLSQINATQQEVSRLSTVASPDATNAAALEGLQARLASLRSTYAALLAFSSGSASNLLTVIEPAAPSVEPASPKLLINTLVGGLIGALVAAAFVFANAYLDEGIRDPETVQAVLGVGTLGTVGRMKGHDGNEIYRLATLMYPHSSVAEAYRALRTNLEFASVDGPLHMILVTSAIPREGKTVTAANLAVAFAQAGRSVLLVDADLRRPGVHLVLGLPNSVGLTTLLRDEGASVDDVAAESAQPNLRVLTAGPAPPNPAEQLGSRRMEATVARLRSAADVVIFDSPPLQAVTDAAILSRFVDGTIVVVDASRSRTRSARVGREALAKVGAHVLGAVLNRASGAATAYDEYHAYYRQQDDGGETHAARVRESPAGSGR
jgi:tyrosine-protein kinase